MDTGNRDILLENVGGYYISLVDTMGRKYTLKAKMRLRISSTAFLDIIDVPASKTILLKGGVRVSGVTKSLLENSALSYKEMVTLLGAVGVQDMEAEIQQAEDEEIIEDDDADLNVVEVFMSDAKARITLQNWLKKGELNKVLPILDNPINVETVKAIIEKNPDFTTPELEEIINKEV